MNKVVIKYSFLKLLFISLLLISLIAFVIFIIFSLKPEHKLSIKNIAISICFIAFALSLAFILLHTIYRVIKYRYPLIINSEGFFNYPTILDSGGTLGVIIGFTGFIPWKYVSEISIKSKYIDSKINIQTKYINIRLSRIPPKLAKSQKVLLSMTLNLIQISFHLKKESPEEIFHIIDEAYSKYKESKNE